MTTEKHAEVKGWDKRDYDLWSLIQQLPSYGMIAPDDRMISRKQVKHMMHVAAENELRSHESRSEEGEIAMRYVKYAAIPILLYVLALWLKFWIERSLGEWMACGIGIPFAILLAIDFERRRAEKAESETESLRAQMESWRDNCEHLMNCSVVYSKCEKCASLRLYFRGSWPEPSPAKEKPAMKEEE